jgi:hypothetical protein
VQALGDEHPSAFYCLVAREARESVVRKALSEIRRGAAESPAKVFTAAMLNYAEHMVDRERLPGLAADKQALADRFRRMGGRGDTPPNV